MRLNLALLFALTATTQLTIAAPAPAPEPAWNDKGTEAGYKVGAVACGAGAYICNQFGHTVGQNVLASAGFCCSSLAAAVTASQSPAWVSAWKATAETIGDAAKVVGGGFSASGKWVAHCTVNVCQMVANVAYRSGQPSTRTIDGPVLENENLIARSVDIDARNPELTQLGSKNTADGGSLEFWGKREVIDARDPDLIQIGSTPTEDGGHLEFWGKREVESLNARWGGTKCASGTITPACDNSHNEAENALCDSLIGNLNGYGTQTIDKTWRQVCYKGQDGKCCTSWSGEILKLKYSDLAANAQTMSSSCSNNGISAKMNGLKIEDTCVNQCLNSGHSCGS